MRRGYEGLPNLDLRYIDTACMGADPQFSLLDISGFKNRDGSAYLDTTTGWRVRGARSPRAAEWPAETSVYCPGSRLGQ